MKNSRVVLVTSFLSLPGLLGTPTAQAGCTEQFDPYLKAPAAAQPESGAAQANAESRSPKASVEIESGPVPTEETASVVAEPPQPPQIDSGPIPEKGKAPMQEGAETATKVAKEAEAKFSYRAPGPIRRAVGAIRDRMRRLIQVTVNKHRIPVIAMDDATPVKARALAMDAFGGLTDDMKSTVSLSEIKADVETTLTRVESYQADTSKFVNECSTLSAQQEQIEAFLKRNKSSGGIVLDLPQVEMEAGKPQVTMYRRYFGSPEALKVYLGEIKTDLKKKLGLKAFGLNDASERVYEQAINIKRLETYRSQLLEVLTEYEQKLGRRAALPADLKGYLDRIEALYKDIEHGNIKHEFAPPAWTADRLHWAQLNGEIKTWFFKVFPEKLEKLEQDSIVKFVKEELSPEDVRALGLEKMAKAAGIIGQTKWTQFGIALAGTSYSGWKALAKPAYDLVVGDAREKEKCAASGDEDSFKRCMHKWLRTKFPKKYILAENEAKPLVNAEGKIDDPKILAQMKDGWKRYDKYHHTQHVEQDLEDAAVATMDTIPHKSAESLQRAAIQASNDSEFQRQGLSYLREKHPQLFVPHRKELEVILSAQPDSEAQYRLISALQDSAKILGADVSDLLANRRNYLANGRVDSAPRNGSDDRGNQGGNPGGKQQSNSGPLGPMYNR